MGAMAAALLLKLVACSRGTLNFSRVIVALGHVSVMGWTCYSEKAREGGLCFSEVLAILLMLMCAYEPMYHCLATTPQDWPTYNCEDIEAGRNCFHTNTHCLHSASGIRSATGNRQEKEREHIG